MTPLLQKAFERASQLSETEQDALAEVMMDFLQSEARWDNLFAQSQDLLAEWTDEALEEDNAGKTRPVEEL